MKLHSWKKLFIVDSIDEARNQGATITECCIAIGICKRTYQRWKKNIDNLCDKRIGPIYNKLALTQSEYSEIIHVLAEDRFVDESPHTIVSTLADEGRYICSESTIYRILRKTFMNVHRGVSKAPIYLKKETLSAKGPNEIWSWDISYLKSTKKRKYYFLYLFLDIFSRKIIGWEIHDSECSIKSSDLAEKLINQENIIPGTLRIHSDNGTPMRSSPMINLLEELKVMQSFSRPRVSNDNAYSESLFKTVKYRPEYPGKGFKNKAEANEWMHEFVYWYNFMHKHSGIGYVTPDQKHRQEDVKILKRREKVYKDAKLKNPERFINGIKNFNIERSVELPNYRLRH